VATVVIVALSAPGFAARAEPASGGLTGVIRTADRSPLAGARLLAAQADDGEVFRSEPTTGDGSFTLSDLPPGSYSLAVEIDDGIYLVQDPLPVVAGVKRVVQIAVGVEPSGSTGSVASATAGETPTPSVWSNPYSAGAIVLGLAIIVGVLVKNVTDDELAATQN
jgi:hypothetical protein